MSSLDFDSMGDRQKRYENQYRTFLMPNLPYIARLDGRAFHTFTKDMPKPYFEPMSNAMKATARYLLETTEALLAYTQSDEITLVFKESEELAFSGNIQKLASCLAGAASAKFMRAALFTMPNYVQHQVPTFDCRVFSLPNRDEVVQNILWRSIDAERNSLTMAAHVHYSQEELQNKKASEKHDLLHAKGINWNDYPAFFKRGSYFRRETKQIPLTEAQWAKIPEQHRYKHGSHVERSVIVEMDMPPFSKIINPVAVIFNQASPETLAPAEDRILKDSRLPESVITFINSFWPESKNSVE